jgi:hypothetical protein
MMVPELAIASVSGREDAPGRSEHERVARAGRHTQRHGALTPAALSVPIQP